MKYFTKIINAFSSVLGETTVQKMSEDSTMESVSGWDSLHFIALIMAIEDEFKIQMTTLEAASLTSVQKINSYLEKTL